MSGLREAADKLLAKSKLTALGFRRSVLDAVDAARWPFPQDTSTLAFRFPRFRRG